ncbi:MAG: hypothetical protein KC636_19675 [Myxococcales bacterium]|nr:hypothetical protein [Myxococcales bacterium]
MHLVSRSLVGSRLTPIAGRSLATLALLALACGGGEEETESDSISGGPGVTTVSGTNPSTTDDMTTEGPTTSDPTTTTNPTTTTTDPSTTEEPTDTTEPTTDTTDPTTDPTTEPTTVTDSDTEDPSTTDAPDLVSMCLLVHKGGDPASITSVRLDPDGSMAELESVELGGGHSPLSTDYRRTGIALCGDRLAHAAQMDDDMVSTIAVGYYGELTVLSEINVPNVEGLLCSPAVDVLFSFGRNAGRGFLRTFTIEPDDTLLTSDTKDLDFKFTGELALYAATHPKLNILYVAGKTKGPVESDVEVHRISYGANAKVVLDAITSTAGNLLLGFAVAPSGDEMAFVGWNGGLAWHNLPGTGVVPPAGSLSILVDNAWQGGNDILIREDLASDETFYYNLTTGTGDIRIAEFQGNTVGEFGSEASAGKRSHFQLAYDESILVAIAQTGAVKTYEVSDQGIALTPVATLNLGGTMTQASALLPCAIK